MTRSQQLIHFHFLAGRIYLPQRQKLKKFLMSLFKEEGKQVAQVNYIFCSDATLLDINKKYLGHNTLTDIITFHYHPADEPILSDIYISLPRVKENSKTFQTSQIKELYRVIFHGALHLCGYSDKTQIQKSMMRRLEDNYLNKYTVPRGTGL